MSDYMTLMGAEDVRRASNQMASAAADMKQAAASIDATFYNFLQRFEELVNRLECAGVTDE